METDKLLDRLWKILDANQTQIRAYDAKAQIVIGIDGIVAAFLGAQAVKIGNETGTYGPGVLKFLLVLTAGSCLVLLARSFYFAIRTVFPTREFGQPDSMIFFGHIDKKFGTNFQKGREAYSALTEEGLRDDLSNQILATAHICNRKAIRFNRGLFAMAFGLALWMLTLGLQFGVEHRETMRRAQEQAICPSMKDRHSN